MSKALKNGAKTRALIINIASATSNAATSLATTAYEAPRDFLKGLFGTPPAPQAVAKRRRRKAKA